MQQLQFTKSHFARATFSIFESYEISTQMNTNKTIYKISKSIFYMK